MMKMNKQINGQYVRCRCCDAMDFFDNKHEMNRIMKSHYASCDVTSFEVVQFVDIDPEHNAYE